MRDTSQPSVKCGRRGLVSLSDLKGKLGVGGGPAHLQIQRALDKPNRAALVFGFDRVWA